MTPSWVAFVGDEGPAVPDVLEKLLFRPPKRDMILPPIPEPSLCSPAASDLAFSSLALLIRPSVGLRVSPGERIKTRWVCEGVESDRRHQEKEHGFEQVSDYCWVRLATQDAPLAPGPLTAESYARKGTVFARHASSDQGTRGGARLIGPNKLENVRDWRSR